MSEEISAKQAGTVNIGDRVVNRLGLGTNRITDTDAARQLLHRALELGVNFIDTARRYTDGASETTIGNTLAPYPKDVVIATKGGWGDTRPDQLRGYVEDSLKRLKTACIELYQLHRVNPDVPLEDSVGELKRLQVEGKIRHLGLSEVTLEQLQRAQKVAPIVSVQNEYNVTVRTHEALLDYCTTNQIVFIPWFPLGGLRGGAEVVAARLADMASRYHASPQQVALAWLLKRSPLMLPIPGTLSVEHLEANIAAAALKLTDADYQTLTDAH